uniref:Lipopolysaccharide kinase n=1 Tax=Thermodesulfobacterium geofontis TaxID=1295609 RepID=A0A7C4NST1_9BACT
MSIIKIEPFEVVSEEVTFFNQIFLAEKRALNLPEPFFEHQKRYKTTKGYIVEGRKFFVKEYLSHFEEGDKEWENLLFLKRLGFNVPKPFFRLRSSERYLLATFTLEGLPLSKLLNEKKDQNIFFLKTLGQLLANLHKQNLYHQDCYLNHFFLDEKTKTLGFLDVSRILVNPCFSLKYRIKDLAQLGYSFEKYLGEKGPSLFQNFLSYYLDLSGTKLKWLVKSLVKFKIWLIRKRTERARKRGKIL